MNHTIKSKLDEWIKEEEEEGYGYFPDKPEPLRAVSCESKNPLGTGKYESNYFSCTEWVNGDGFDMRIFKYNEASKTVEDKMFSLATTDIDGILRCLDALKYFG